MRHVSAIILAAMALSAARVQAATGDIDGDRAVTAADAAMALRYAGGLAAPTFTQAGAADVQADGRVTLADAVRIARIAARVEPLPPSAPLAGAASITVANKDIIRDFTLPGGYVLSGRIRNRLGQSFDGGVAFQTPDGVTWGPTDLDNDGDYSIALPPGAYQPFVLTRRTDYTGNGEETVSESSIRTGASISVSDNRGNFNLVRPDIATTSTVTFDFSGFSRPYGSQADIYLTDTGADAATGGLNSLFANVVFTPTERPVPRGVYWVDTKSYYTLGSGLTQELYIAFNQSLSVPSTSSRTLNFPTLYQLAGDFTGPNGPDALDCYLEQIPGVNGDKAAAYVPERFGGYLVEIPPGNHIASIYVATQYMDTVAEYLLPFTMPARSVTKDISPPTFPTFRVVSGIVLAPDGTPLENARVQMDSVPKTIPAAGLYAYHGDTITDEDGLYALALPDGDYTVTVTPG